MNASVQICPATAALEHMMNIVGRRNGYLVITDDETKTSLTRADILALKGKSRIQFLDERSHVCGSRVHRWELDFVNNTAKVDKTYPKGRKVYATQAN